MYIKKITTQIAAIIVEFASLLAATRIHFVTYHYMCCYITYCTVTLLTCIHHNTTLENLLAKANNLYSLIITTTEPSIFTEYILEIWFATYHLQTNNIQWTTHLYLLGWLEANTSIIYIICDPKSNNRPYGACNFRSTVCFKVIAMQPSLTGWWWNLVSRKLHHSTA